MRAEVEQKGGAVHAELRPPPPDDETQHRFDGPRIAYWCEHVAHLHFVKTKAGHEGPARLPADWRKVARHAGEASFAAAIARLSTRQFLQQFAGPAFRREKAGPKDRPCRRLRFHPAFRPPAAFGSVRRAAEPPPLGFATLAVPPRPRRSSRPRRRSRRPRGRAGAASCSAPCPRRHRPR